MGLFFKSQHEKSIDAVLENCDLKFMRAMIRAYYNEGIMEKNLVAVLDAFDKNPCRKTAADLLNYDFTHFGTMFSGGFLVKDNMVSDGIDPYDSNNIQDYIAKTTGELVGNKEERDSAKIEEILAEREKTEKDAIKIRNEKKLSEMFDGCDFVLAKGILHAEFDGPSDENFGTIDDNKLLSLLHAYDEDPCRENALSLLDDYYDNSKIHSIFFIDATSVHVKEDLEKLGADFHSVTSVKEAYIKYIDSLLGY